MSMTRVGVALGAATVLGLGLSSSPYAAPAAAAPCVGRATETKGFSSVDLDGPEIAFTEATKYDEARIAVTKSWNALHRVKILADTATTVNDLEWRDYSKDDGKGAYWERHGNTGVTDYIYLNRKKLDDGREKSKEGRMNVLGHELGHALGLCHKRTNVASILWERPDWNLWITAPTDTDKANYKKLWG